MNEILLEKEPQNKTHEFILGIDEAGRGPVLGPMVYATAYYPKLTQQKLKRFGVADSKVLNENQRDQIFSKLKDAEDVGFCVEVLDSEELSKKMLRINKVNLNTLSHDAAANLIRRVLEKGINVVEVYVDTVGTPEKYQAKLKQLFPGIEITVSKKADSLYPIVSAASICAKVIRDHILKHWNPAEKDLNMSYNFGSGYPSDPTTKSWLQNNLDPVFGFPRLVRFSWKTSDVILNKASVPIKWINYEDDEASNKYKLNNNERHGYFVENNLERVSDL